MPGPRTKAEADSWGLSMAHAMRGFANELEAMSTGDPSADPLLMSQFRRIMVQLHEIAARGKAATSASQQPQMERQSGVPEPVGARTDSVTRRPLG
jgi:hypothetical protein